MSKDNVRRVGIDAGSAYLKVVLLSPEGEVKDFIYTPHFGEPLKRLRAFFKDELKTEEFILGYTGFYSKLLKGIFDFEPEDPVRALISAIHNLCPSCKNIIDVGAKGSRLIELNKGKFKDFSQNSLCAAGTGSFLDQQMERLKLSYEDLKDFPFIEDPPRIAARCSVFAKTDLIHRQQDGYSKEEMWNGLCRGMAINLVQTLLSGRILEGETVLTGGVALNRWVVNWLKSDLGDNLKTFPYAHIASAIGAALSSDRITHLSFIRNRDWEVKRVENLALRSSLCLKKSRYPNFETINSYIDEEETEVRVIKNPKSNLFYLGVDIGSTSTKAVLMEENEEIVADFYRKTEGNPLKATSFIFKAIEKFLSDHNLEAEIIGAGTTGSGRKVVGLVIGADIIINEITAHAKGALKFDKEIKTIFEIGGQDSKYTRLDRGNIIESNLNYICAAGTGSFVEEQAAKLNIPLNDVGRLSLKRKTPYTSDRCTVFMEEDVERLLEKGYKREEAMAAVLYSVVQNYLSKVVENRPIQEKIAFQGATARNIGLVAALENYLDKEILVSPYCHVLGAYGAALSAKEYTKDTKFKGLGLYKREIKLSSETCAYCANHCKITYAHIEGEKEIPSWGYMCGREPEEKRMRKEENYTLFERRKKFLREREGIKSEKVIGIPLVLGFYSYLPFWREFFNSLGFNIKTTEKTDQGIIEEGAKLSSADFCLPVKVIYGHFSRLLKMNTDFILLPHMINMGKSDYYTYVCPYGQMFPSLLKSVIPDDYPKDKILSPILDLTWTEKENIKELYKKIGKKTNSSYKDVERAWKEGWNSYTQFMEKCRDEGRGAIQNLKEKGIVILGRPYSLYDDRVSSNLPLEIAKILKLKVFPPDFIPFNKSIKWQSHRMFWDYGRTILNALRYVSENENLFAIYITHFACGPDSFLITYAEEIMKGKPFMILEVDEHSSTGGYTTRIEAFREAIKSYKAYKPKRFYMPTWEKKIPDYKDRKIWIPSMHPVGARFVASVFKKFGYDAETLPTTDRVALNIGKSLTLGKECLPAVVTIGTFVKKLKDDNLDPKKQAFFMATSDGPCRFGQYVNLHKIILERIGYKDVSIMALSSYNAYAGFSQKMRMALWRAVLFSDMLLKLRCKIKPYEQEKGLTQRVFKDSIERMERAIEQGKEGIVFKRAVEDFTAIPINSNIKKPLVGIVGEIYVRCDSFSNENIIEFIETNGGEVWLVPTSEWLSYTIYSQIQRAIKQRKWKGLFEGSLTNWFTQRSEHKLYGFAKNLLYDRLEPRVEKIIEKTEPYIPFECGTEAVLTIGRAIIFARDNGASIVVNVSPFTCMPGTITTALFKKVQEDYGIPVVNMFYDGEEGINEKLGVYLRNFQT